MNGNSVFLTQQVDTVDLVLGVSFRYRHGYFQWHNGGFWIAVSDELGFGDVQFAEINCEDANDIQLSLEDSCVAA